MASSWSVSGEYMEACSCDFFCPCIPKNVTTPATHDFCKVALTFDIRDGFYGATPMTGVRFVLVAQSKAIMAHGDWIGGLIIDNSASDEQVAAVAAIAGAEGNGPLGMFASLISDFRGIERADIEFIKDHGSCSVRIDGMIEQSIVGIESLSRPGEFVCIDNSSHPVNPRLNFAEAVKNMIRCFGIEWQATGKPNNGHFTSFDWQGEAS